MSSYFVLNVTFFFSRGNTEWTNSSKKFYLIFVHVFRTFVSGLILLCLDNVWFYDLRAGYKKIGDRLNIVFSPDVI